MTVIDLAGLAVRRDGRALLENVRWRLEPGQRWAVLGANGSGKTTLLNALAGYVTPGEGTVRVLGRRYGRDDWRELRRSIGLVSALLMQRVEPGQTALNVVASGRDAMLNLWGPVPAADRARARALLKSVGAAALADRVWGLLSQGERQRVFIGRALMADPKLLLLDEPCAGLDPAARENFLSFLQRLAARRRAPALVLATHHVEEIVPAFTHALLLKNGRVLAAGPLASTLTSTALSQALDAPVRLEGGPGRYRLTVRPRRNAVL